MSASLIGRLTSSTFRVSTTAVSPLFVWHSELHHKYETHSNGPMSFQGLPASISNRSYVAGLL